MVKIGNTNDLEILRIQDVGVYLDGGELGDILMPKKYVDPELQIGDTVKAFIYKDSEDRLIATSQTPIAEAGNLAFLQVVASNNMGAFVDWGLEKDLLIPFREQSEKMKEGRKYLVYIYFDEVSSRIVGTTRLHRFIDNADLDVEVGEEVKLQIAKRSNLGYQAVINDKYLGLLYNDQIHSDLRNGDIISGYIDKIRPDNKIDLTITKKGFERVEDAADEILEILSQFDGYIDVTDKSSPATIEEVFGMSKKTFKRALGTLYKKKLVEIKDNGILKKD